jgi:hypothetical protein
MRPGWLAALVCATALSCSSCSAEDVSTSGDCASHYVDVAQAPSRHRLDDELLSTVDPSVVGLRVQGTGKATGYEHQPADIVDLLNGKGRRVMQIEVLQLASGDWYAGRWSQCID